VNRVIGDVNVTRYVRMNNRHIHALHLTLLWREI